MAGGVILENLNGKKLFVLVSLLLFCQLACFLIGGLVGKSSFTRPSRNPVANVPLSLLDVHVFLLFAAPTPSATDMVLGSKCLYNDSNPWSYIRGKGQCFSYQSDIYKDSPVANTMANDIVFTFQVIHSVPRENVHVFFIRRRAFPPFLPVWLRLLTV